METKTKTFDAVAVARSGQSETQRHDPRGSARLFEKFGRTRARRNAVTAKSQTCGCGLSYMASISSACPLRAIKKSDILEPTPFSDWCRRDAHQIISPTSE